MPACRCLLLAICQAADSAQIHICCNRAASGAFCAFAAFFCFFGLCIAWCADLGAYSGAWKGLVTGTGYMHSRMLS
jgi:hypothetical protein